MKKVLIVLFFLISLYSNAQEYREIDWKTYVNDVVYLSDSTFSFTAKSIDVNDVGAGEVGNYFADNVGNRYEIINVINDTTYVVYDFQHKGVAPQSSKIGNVYQSVGDGEAEFVGGIDYTSFDKSARWKMVASDNELLYRYAVDSVRGTWTVDTLQIGGEEGSKMSWNENDYTLNIPSLNGAVLQVGQELYVIVYNGTGSEIEVGKAVSAIGSFNGRPSVSKCSAKDHTGITRPVYLTTSNIPTGGYGVVTQFGYSRGVNTSGLTEGAEVWLSPTIDGELTSTKPAFPFYPVRIGGVTTAAVDGVIFVTIESDPANTIRNAWNGAFRESFDFRTSSNGTTVTGSLTPSNGHPNMTMMFSSGFAVLDTDPAQTITLTAGTDTNPVSNYVYIPESTKQLTVSTSDWPVTVEHIRVAIVVLQSAATTQVNGALRNQNWNDHVQDTHSNQGHLLHLGDAIRTKIPATYWAGVDFVTTVNTAASPDNVYFSSTGGTIIQFHRQSFPSFDLATGSDIHIFNDPTVPYRTVTNLNQISVDANGNSLNNTSFSVVIWGVCNKSGEPSHLFLNLPEDAYLYSFPENAIADADGFSVYSIPQIYAGVGFLIARLTFQYKNNSWTLVEEEDLRGLYPNNIAGGGGGGGGLTTFLGLTDTPPDYTNKANYLLSVNAAETALQFIPRDTILLTDLDSTGFRVTIPQVTFLNDTLSELRSDINLNASIISSHTATLNDHEGRISTNETDIQTNLTNINQNTSDISTNASDIVDLNTSIGVAMDSIDSLRVDINANTQAIDAIVIPAPQTLSTSGSAGNISISDGNTINIDVSDADPDPLNEIQGLHDVLLENSVSTLGATFGGIINIDRGSTLASVLSLTSSGVNTTMGSLNSSYFHMNTTASSGFYFYDKITTPNAIQASLDVTAGDDVFVGDGVSMTGNHEITLFDSDASIVRMFVGKNTTEWASYGFNSATGRMDLTTNNGTISGSIMTADADDVEFSTVVSGEDGVDDDDFITKGQLDGVGQAVSVNYIPKSDGDGTWSDSYLYQSGNYVYSTGILRPLELTAFDNLSEIAYNDATRPIDFANVNIGTGNSKLLPILSTTVQHNSGYRANYALGVRRGGSSQGGWGTDTTAWMIGLSQSDNNLTEAYYFNIGGHISHSTGEISTQKLTSRISNTPNQLAIKGGKTLQTAVGEEISTVSFVSNDASILSTDNVAAEIRAESGWTNGAFADLNFYVTTNLEAPYLLSRMIIKGQYGYIGMGTSSPKEILTVENQMAVQGKTTDAAGGLLTLRRESTVWTTGKDTIGLISFDMDDTSNPLQQLASIHAEDIGASSTYGSDVDLVLSTSNAGVKYERLRASRHALTYTSTGSDATEGAKFIIDNTDTGIDAGNNYGEIQFYSNDASSGGVGVSGAIENRAVNAGVSSALDFYTRTSAGALQRGLTIDNVGNIGMKEITPAYDLEVTDASSTVVQITSTSNTGKSHLFFGDGDANGRGRFSYDHTNDDFTWYVASVIRMNLNTSGLYLQTGGRVNEFSTDGNLTGNSDIAVPTEKAVKTYVDGKISTDGTMSGNSDTVSPSEKAVATFVTNEITNSSGNNSTQILTGTAVAMNVSNGKNATLTLTAATTITMSGLRDGDEGSILVTNASSSSYRITFAGYTYHIYPSVWYSGETVAVSGNSHLDIFSYKYIGGVVVINGALGLK